MELRVFENKEFGKVRTDEVDGKILFCGSDVAKILGYTNPNKAINHHCRAITKRYTHISGKMQEINFISEGDVYRLITHSKLPGAEKFEAWVFDEVLPQIRKTGSYGKSYDSEILQGILNVMSVFADGISDIYDCLERMAEPKRILSEEISEKVETSYLSSPPSKRMSRSVINRLPLESIGEIIKWIEEGNLSYREMAKLSRGWCSEGLKILNDRERIGHESFYRFRKSIQKISRKGDVIEAVFKCGTVIEVDGNKVSRMQK